MEPIDSWLHACLGPGRPFLCDRRGPRKATESIKDTTLDENHRHDSPSACIEGAAHSAVVENFKPGSSVTCDLGQESSIGERS